MEINALFDLWDKFANKMQNYTDTLTEPFYHFPIGTPSVEVIEWFGQQNPYFVVVEHNNGNGPSFSVVCVPANIQTETQGPDHDPTPAIA